MATRNPPAFGCMLDVYVGSLRELYSNVEPTSAAWALEEAAALERAAEALRVEALRLRRLAVAADHPRSLLPT